MLFRYKGKTTTRIQLSNVFEQTVEPDEVFDVPDKWAYALAKRGTPVERVVPPLSSATAEAESGKPARAPRGARAAEPKPEGDGVQ